ncbi:Uncharacterised protein [Niallia circulans]|nr:Uncharacterised protein [Niallia circulans]
MNNQIFNILFTKAVLSESFILIFLSHYIYFRVFVNSLVFPLIFLLRKFVSVYLLKKNKQLEPFYQFLFVNIEVVLYGMGYSSLLKISEITKLESVFNNQEFFAFLVLIPLVLIFFYYLYSLLIYIIRHSNTIMSIESSTKRSLITKSIALILSVLLVLLTTDIIFALIYSMFYSVYTSNLSIPLSDYFYLSFTIHFTQPLIGENNISYIIEVINTNFFIRIIHITHVLITKIIDLSVIGLIGSHLLNLINKKN